jgi:hypothetical protein
MASTLCRECGERFQVKPRAGRDTYRRRSTNRPPAYPFARYCSQKCRKAASRKRLLDRSGVTDTPVGSAGRSGVTSPSQNTETIEVFSPEKTVLDQPKGRLTLWRWYQRLDGSCDLYCDSEMTTRHVARIARRGGCYRLAKPSDLTSAVWTERPAAERAVRNLLRKAA